MPRTQYQVYGAYQCECGNEWNNYSIWMLRKRYPEQMLGRQMKCKCCYSWCEPILWQSSTMQTIRQNYDLFEDHISRMFGRYKCDKCFHPWGSVYTWGFKRLHNQKKKIIAENIPMFKQQCKKCYNYTFAYLCEELKHNIDQSNKKNKQHPSELCQMCDFKKRSCSAYCV